MFRDNQFVGCLYLKVTKASEESPVWCLDIIVQRWSPTVFEISEIYSCDFKKSTLKNVKCLCRACQQGISLATKALILRNITI